MPQPYTLKGQMPSPPPTLGDYIQRLLTARDPGIGPMAVEGHFGYGQMPWTKLFRGEPIFGDPGPYKNAATFRRWFIDNPKVAEQYALQHGRSSVVREAQVPSHVAPGLRWGQFNDGTAYLVPRGVADTSRVVSRWHLPPEP